MRGGDTRVGGVGDALAGPPPARRSIRGLRRLTNARSGLAIWVVGLAVALGLMLPTIATAKDVVVAKGLAILNQACDRAEEPVLRHRVEKLLVPLWHLQLSWPDRYALRTEDAPALLARFRQALETNRITFSSQGGPSTALLAEYEKRYGMKTP